MNRRLNTFQKSMLRWNDLHASNAIHVVRISGELEVKPVGKKVVLGLTFDK